MQTINRLRKNSRVRALGRPRNTNVKYLGVPIIKEAKENRRQLSFF